MHNLVRQPCGPPAFVVPLLTRTVTYLLVGTSFRRPCWRTHSHIPSARLQTARANVANKGRDCLSGQTRKHAPCSDGTGKTETLFLDSNLLRRFLCCFKRSVSFRGFKGAFRNFVIPFIAQGHGFAALVAARQVLLGLQNIFILLSTQVVALRYVHVDLGRGLGGSDVCKIAKLEELNETSAKTGSAGTCKSKTETSGGTG